MPHAVKQRQRKVGACSTHKDEGKVATDKRSHLQSRSLLHTDACVADADTGCWQHQHQIEVDSKAHACTPPTSVFYCRWGKYTGRCKKSCDTAVAAQAGTQAQLEVVMLQTPCCMWCPLCAFHSPPY